MRFQFFLFSLALTLGGCVSNSSAPQVDDSQNVTEQKMDELLSSKIDPWLQKRITMVESQIRRRGIQDERVQLAPNGRMVIPVGRNSQVLQLIEKSLDGSLRRSKITPVAFVPMTGLAEKK